MSEQFRPILDALRNTIAETDAALTEQHHGLRAIVIRNRLRQLRSEIETRAALPNAPNVIQLLNDLRDDATALDRALNVPYPEDDDSEIRSKWPAFKQARKEIVRLTKQLRLLEERIPSLMLTAPAPVVAVSRRNGKSEKAARMTVEEANKKAMQLTKQLGKVFFALSETEQARRIGCHWQTWTKTDFYKTAKKKRPPAKTRQGKPGSPAVVSLTGNLESQTGEGDREEVLEQLIADQDADKDPSPLDDDPPDSRPRTVHCRKRL